MAIVTDIFKDGAYWVWVNCGCNTDEHYENLGYEIPRVKNNKGFYSAPRGTRALVKIDDLPDGSTVKVTKICDYCPIDSTSRVIPNQAYESILKSREKNTEGKDCCYECRWKIISENKRNNVKYEKSAEYFCKNNDLEYLLKEFSSKNIKEMSKISSGTKDKYLWVCPIFREEHEYDMSMELRLKAGCGCPYCAGKRVNHTNCLWTTHPSVAKLLWNPEDGNAYTAKSGKKVDWKCPQCNSKLTRRIADITIQGLTCPICTDGISYPEKFILGMLSQLDIEFEYQKRFKWAKGYRYDFYIPMFNLIIEAHGAQHYERPFNRLTIKEQKEIDDSKQQLAADNDISSYIIIDSRISDLDYIKQNILLNNQLTMLLDLRKIDWLKCHDYSCKSFVKNAFDLWNEGKIINEICEILKLSHNTIKTYLKQGSKINLCDYDAHEQSKKGRFVQRAVVMLDLNGNRIDEFESLHEASRQTNVTVGNIWSSLKGKNKTAGGFKWIYKDAFTQ